MHDKIDLSGAWTRRQLDALQAAGWVRFTFPSPTHYLLEITTHADTCKWFLVRELDPAWQLQFTGVEHP